jgi:hypothetical protein
LTITPFSMQNVRALEPDDRVVRALPLLRRRESLDPLHQHAPVPGAVEHGHAAESRKRRPEAPQKVMALLALRWRGVRRHMHMARVERLDQPPQGSSLAGGVPALEHHRERRSEPTLVAGELAAQRQPERRQPRLRRVEPLRVLLLGERQRQVELV